MPSISKKGVIALQQIVEEACSETTTEIPGASVVVVNSDGQEIFAHSAGRRGIGAAQMTLDNIFWIASCTKMITGIACMQLVERGILHLDDSQLVENLCPELGAVEVLQPDGTLAAKRRGITLRMLLTHTAGFGYTFFNERVRDFGRPVGYDEFSGHFSDMMQPLLHQPGEAWEYGINIDWAGILVERATGMSLNDYMRKSIFEPLGLSDISLFPTKSMRDRLAFMHHRDSQGNLSLRDHLHRRPLTCNTEEDVRSTFNSGGAGAYAKPQDYCQILAVLLNNGTSPTSGRKILDKASVEEMFQNQIPHFPDFGRQGIPDAKSDLTNPIPNIYPWAGAAPQGWGLTFMQTPSSTGRSPKTVQWAGLANLWWWCDRETGVAGMICTQILPFADLKTLQLWLDVEGCVYSELVSEEKK